MWQAVRIYRETSDYAIELEMEQETLEDLEADWGASRLNYSTRIKGYVGRSKEEFGVKDGELVRWESKYVSCRINVDLGVVAAIESHEALEQGE